MSGHMGLGVGMGINCKSARGILLRGSKNILKFIYGDGKVTLATSVKLSVPLICTQKWDSLMIYKIHINKAVEKITWKNKWFETSGRAGCLREEFLP